MLLLTNACATPVRAVQAEDKVRAEEFFELRVRPVLVERCQKCHAGAKVKGGLRLDSRASLLKGGESGPAIVVGNSDASLLLQAVRHQDGLAMPPDGKLKETQIAALAEWIKAGAVWPDVSGTPASTPLGTSPATGSIVPIAPNDGELARSLQLWLRADSLTFDDNAAVPVWPDQSGHGRDVSATKGVRPGGVGMPGRFVARSSLMGRPAVHFDTSTGLAASPGNPVPLRGDAAFTIIVVLNLKRHQSVPAFDGVIGIGNPASPGDPGKPLAALIQINRGQDESLRLAGGWNHDASLGKGSFTSWFGKPIILTLVKRPGPMRSTTRLYFNGVSMARGAGGLLEGRDEVPDIQHRADIGVYLGKALAWCGSIEGDLGEVAVYDKALADEERAGIEDHLGQKFGIVTDPARNIASPAIFTRAEREFWAYRPVGHPAIPQVMDTSWAVSPIDRFILVELEKRGLKPASPADRLALLRRVTFDLTGLPPSPAEVKAFLADRSPHAFETVVNRLVGSPHYGEKWGRHWLDVVRYAESTANDANAVMRYAWRYRDYVINAFNQDLPYDQFLIEQLAGDLLPPTSSTPINTRRIVATGYLMIGPKALAETDKEQSRLDIVDDQIDVTGRAMLGLTLACARCHDHKFDAIRATDYYALAGIFRSTEPFQDENRNATMWWEFPVPQGNGAEPIMVMAPKESTPRNLRVHLRGNRFTLGKIAPRGMPGVVLLGGETSVDARSSIDANQLSSGRLELARWIASPTNPLTARVMVNRIWQHHFGEGLVATSDNFGTRGARPSHPELLDWLASRFVASGWSVKEMHRLILLSNTYQQSCDQDESAQQADPERRLRSSFSRRRLSAEEIRDAVLAVSGTLDRTPGGKQSGELAYAKAEDIKSKIRPNRLAPDDPIYQELKKRSVYLPVIRNMLPDVLALFDAADPNGVTAKRNETTVASQSLFLLNSRFMREQARAFAERLLAVAALTDEQRIEQAHVQTLGRPATADERADALAFLSAYRDAPAARSRPEQERRLAAWQAFCQSILCSNEFLYVQ